MSARRGLELDTDRRLPGFERVLAAIVATKGDYAGAAQFMKSYLEHNPSALDAGEARQQLAELERLAGQPAAQAKPQP
jgi:hypothetical protein